MNSHKQISRWTLIFVVLSFAVISFSANKISDAQSEIIRWDGYGYYVYLPAIFIYDDLGEFDFVEDHFERYNISSNIYQVIEAENGKKIPIYNIGLSILWSPFFAIAHGYSKLSKTYPADGMSFPYQLAIVLSALVYLLAGLYFLRKFLLNFFSDRIVAITLLIIAFGTNYFYYNIWGKELTHIYLFAGYATFMFAFLKYQREQRLKYLLISGLVAGFLVLVRSSEIVVFLIPLFYGLNFTNLKNRLPKNIKITAQYVLIAISVFLIQVIYYKMSTGYWFLNGYAGHSFDLLSPHLIEGYFGYRRGWLVWTPVMLFSFCGLVLMYKNEKKWFFSLFSFILVNSYIIFSWHIWWYGNTFGSRPVIQSYALLALPLAVFLEYISVQKKVVKWSTIIVILFFILLNLFQTWQYKQGIIPLDFVSKTYYWHTFLNTEKDKKAFKYLDIDEKIPDANYLKYQYLKIDSNIVSPGKGSENHIEYITLMEHELTAEEAEKLKEQWFRYEIKFSYLGDAFDKWSAPKLVTDIRGSRVKKWTGLKLPVVVENPKLDSITIEQQMPELAKGDQWKVMLWNISSDSLVIRDLEIIILNPKD